MNSIYASSTQLIIHLCGSTGSKPRHAKGVKNKHRKPNETAEQMKHPTAFPIRRLRTSSTIEARGIPRQRGWCIALKPGREDNKYETIPQNGGNERVISPYLSTNDQRKKKRGNIPILFILSRLTTIKKEIIVIFPSLSLSLLSALTRKILSLSLAGLPACHGPLILKPFEYALKKKKRKSSSSFLPFRKTKEFCCSVP